MQFACFLSLVREKNRTDGAGRLAGRRARSLTTSTRRRRRSRQGDRGALERRNIHFLDRARVTSKMSAAMGVAMTSARCNRAVRVSVGRKSSANAGAFRSKNITRAGANTSFALGNQAVRLRRCDAFVGA